jgi:hypothetical protein
MLHDCLDRRAPHARHATELAFEEIALRGDAERVGTDRTLHRRTGAAGWSNRSEADWLTPLASGCRVTAVECGVDDQQNLIDRHHPVAVEIARARQWCVGVGVNAAAVAVAAAGGIIGTRSDTS